MTKKEGISNGVKKNLRIVGFIALGVLLIFAFSKIFEVIYALFFNWIF